MEDMNEEKAKEILSQTVKIPIVPFESIFNIEVSGFFLKRCQVLLNAIGRELGEPEVKRIIEKLKTKEGPANTAEETVWILIGLIDAMEKSAYNNKLTTEVEMTAEDLLKTLQNNNFGASTES
jgi:hypothetical protein